MSRGQSRAPGRRARDTAPAKNRYRLPEPLALAGRVHRLERVADETLRAADRTRHVETAVEVTQVLGGLERLLERGLREAQRGPQTLELARIDVAHRRIIASARLRMLALS